MEAAQSKEETVFYNTRKIYRKQGNVLACHGRVIYIRVMESAA